MLYCRRRVLIQLLPYLNDIIANYLNTNKNITGECKFCRKNISEKIDLYSLPKYLILYFGRTIGNKYISNQINFLDEYNFENVPYRITSVIYHSKLGKKFGHYTASCKCDNNVWYYFNDSYVTKEHFRNKSHLKPIILIYEKI